MKKNLFFHFSVLAMLIVLISACSSKKSEYTNVIPSMPRKSSLSI